MKSLFLVATLILSQFALVACGGGAESYLFTDTKAFSEIGHLEHKSILLKVDAEYEINHDENTIAVDAFVKILKFNYERSYVFTLADDLLYNENLVDYGVGYSETITNDKGEEYNLKIAQIKNDYIVIDISSESFILSINSLRSNPNLNIDKAEVRVLKPLKTTIELKKVQ